MNLDHLWRVTLCHLVGHVWSHYCFPSYDAEHSPDWRKECLRCGKDEPDPA